jgi:hypothetical protein
MIYRIGNTALPICAMNWFLALMLQAAAVQPSDDVPSHPSTVALTVGEKDLFPEGAFMMTKCNEGRSTSSRQLFSLLPTEPS